MHKQQQTQKKNKKQQEQQQQQQHMNAYTLTMTMSTIYVTSQCVHVLHSWPTGWLLVQCFMRNVQLNLYLECLKLNMKCMYVCMCVCLSVSAL